MSTLKARKSAPRTDTSGVGSETAPAGWRRRSAFTGIAVAIIPSALAWWGIISAARALLHP